MTLILALTAAACVVVAGVGAAWITVKRGLRRDSALHEVGHAMLLSLAPSRKVSAICISADSAGVPAATHHGYDLDFVASDASRPWWMLVCLAGQAAEAVAGSSFNKDQRYRELLHRISIWDSPNSDSSKWEFLAQQHLGIEQAARQGEAVIAARRLQDFQQLTEFFELNKALLIETATWLLENGGAMAPDELAHFLARVRHTDSVSPAIVGAAGRIPTLAPWPDPPPADCVLTRGGA